MTEQQFHDEATITRKGSNLLLALVLLVSSIFSLNQLINNYQDIKHATAGAIPQQPYHLPKANRIVIDKWIEQGRTPNQALLPISDQLVAAQPYWAPNWYIKSWVDFVHNDTDSANTSINQALKAWPTSGKLLNASAYMLTRLKKYEEALFIGKKAFWSQQIPPEKPLDLVFSLVENQEDLATELSTQSLKDLFGNEIEYAPSIYRYAQAKDNYGVMRVVVFHTKWPKHKNIFNDFSNRSIKHDAPADLISIRKLAYQRDDVQLINGDFEQSIVNGAMGWVGINNIAGAKAELDRRYTSRGKSALKVEFSGEENVDLYAPYQYIPLTKENTTYKVTGYWRGDGITTRSTPRIEVLEVKNGKSNLVNTIEGQRGSWYWEKHEVDYKNVNEASFLLIRVVRKKSSNLNNAISGSIWLDNVMLAF